jgi:hypothetical protein
MNLPEDEIRQRIARLQFLVLQALQKLDEGRLAECCELIDAAIELEQVDSCRNYLLNVKR